MPESQEVGPAANTPQHQLKKPDAFLDFIYKGAMLIGCLSLLFSAGYLFYYLFKSPSPDQIRLETMVAFNAERRMALISTAFAIAMSFGFIGFALFIIDAKGDIEGSAELPSASFKVAKMSPGIFAILCATVIIIICAKIKINYSVEAEQTEPGINITKTESQDSTITDTTKDTPLPGFVTGNRHKPEGNMQQKNSSNH